MQKKAAPVKAGGFHEGAVGSRSVELVDRDGGDDGLAVVLHQLDVLRLPARSGGHRSSVVGNEPETHAVRGDEAGLDTDAVEDVGGTSDDLEDLLRLRGLDLGGLLDLLTREVRVGHVDGDEGQRDGDDGKAQTGLHGFSSVRF